VSNDFVRWANANDLDVAEEGTLAEYMWVDIETTGLAQEDVILEIGIILTDAFGWLIENGRYKTLVWANSEHYQARFDGMDDFVRDMHTKSGLLQEIELNKLTIPTPEKAATEIAAWLPKWADKGTLLPAGSSVHFDYGFLRHYMKPITNFIHPYRQINVSTVKEQCSRLHPELYAKLNTTWKPRKIHRSMDDLVDTIHEHNFYVDNFFFIPSDTSLNEAGTHDAQEKAGIVKRNDDPSDPDFG
jgi:oligoribonuclease